MRIFGSLDFIIKQTIMTRKQHCKKGSGLSKFNAADAKDEQQ